ncbi:MAG: glycerol-3-phosphate 1-O-acyltransferase PlsY [Deltaproteobacteria bacterium]|nr:glycerol-3-phosphate 1-O-acyltransferase PlsY [Deltaproteobacteria bacterium]
MVVNVLLVIFAYLLGSIPTGLVLATVVAGIDPRQDGSRNIGATNVMRTAGKVLGAATLIGDVLKGVIPVCIALFLERGEWWVAGAGLAAFLGHCFPIYIGFKGGKGVATALGIYLPLTPLAVLVNVFVFASALGVTRMVSVGSISAAIAMPLLIWLKGYLLPPSAPLAYLILSICVDVIIIFRHKENIKRLLTGKENKLWGES